MITQHPKEAPAWSWLFAATWMLVIWLTVPFARRLEHWAKELAGGAGIFTTVVLLLLLLGALYIIYLFVRDRKRYRLGNYCWLLLIGGLLAWKTVELKDGSPIEALHFIEYGLLALFFFRAVVQHFCSPAAYGIAMALCLCAGIVDESIQWLTPRRLFDWRDIGLNAYASVLILILLAQGLRPSYLRPMDRKGWAAVLRMALWPLSLAMLCLMNTPRMTHRVVEAFPVLKKWSPSWGEMTEYGYLYEDEEIGVFKSRLSPAALAAEDEQRGFEASQILSLRRYADYGEFLREYSVLSDPYLHEARVHLHSREYRLKHRIKYRGVDDEKYRKYTLIAYREEQIMRKYFPVIMKDYWHQISPEWWADMATELPQPMQPFYSKVSRGLIVGFSQKQVVLAYGLLMLLILSVSRWLKRSG